MRIDIATLFPEMCERVLSESIIGRARLSGAVDIFCHDIRTFTENKHRRVDDKPYGGGTGMVMAAQPIHDCIISIMTQINPASPRLIYAPKENR
jgi:tRNA (guanine37-N1)-methyltransferase